MNSKLLLVAEKNQARAFDIIRTLRIQEIWKNMGGEAHLVGSLRTGLLIKNLDIDFHVYTDDFSVKRSFDAIAQIAGHPKINKINYMNLIDTEEKCIEWHLSYIDKHKEEWNIDIIHIHKESKYAGWFERVANRISEVLTLETKLTILSIKNDIPANVKVMGIEIYQAVIRDGIRNYKEFMLWKKNQPQNGIIEWIP